MQSGKCLKKKKAVSSRNRTGDRDLCSTVSPSLFKKKYVICLEPSLW